jgi:hypothetical protein
MKFTTLAVLLLSAATTTLAAPAVPNPALGPSPDYCSYGCKVRRAFGFETAPVLVKEAVSALSSYLLLLLLAYSCIFLGVSVISLLPHPSLVKHKLTRMANG